jgi:serine/threonine protein kinase
MPSDPNRVEEIFTAALAKASPEERSRYLNEACAGDAGLRRRVEALLKAYGDAGSFLQHPEAREGGDSDPPRGPHGEPRDSPTAGEGPGARIGPYKLLQQIGEGGMGIVYMAEQEQPVRRRVALKIIKPGMDSKQVIARFEAERQALALMDHTNIAKVHDAGTTETGRPYFVMELVHGVPITQFSDENQLSPRERLELFVPICQAIQHAHQKGIIHRDIKPSNVLVTLYDEKPVPKVIDFGVAKAIERRLTEKTLFTQFGMLVGTFEYMSPEQAEMNALGVDTRSDIYSLGVLLYELLTGTTPLERERLREAAFDELVRLIKEEEPPRPSARLSSSNTLPKIALARKTEPAKLANLLRGEIDWIVMKALEKDRNRRYDTASSFAADLHRYLHDEPVQACSPSRLYLLRKFARRNRVTLGTALLIGLALLAGTVIAAWQAAEARKNAEMAQSNERDALAARRDLQVANDELKTKRNEVEATLARSLLRPLARQPGPLTDLEVESLWELAGSSSEELWKQFVIQALRDPLTTRQLMTRAEPALRAAVGLDPKKRRQIEQLLLERLQDQKLPDGQRGNVALIAVSLGGLTPAAQARVARTLLEILGKVNDPSTLRELAEGLSALAPRMEPKEATRICTQAATILSQGLAKPTSTALEPLAQGLAAIATRMEPEDAVCVCSQAAAVMTKKMQDNTSRSWVVEAFTSVLLPLAPFIDSEQAAEAGVAVCREMNGWSSRDRKLESLAALAARMEPKEATRVCSLAAATLTGLIKDPHFRGDGTFFEVWVQGLKKVAPYLDSKDAAKAAAVLAEQMIKMKPIRQQVNLFSSGLASLAPRLDSGEAAKVAAVLDKEFTKTNQNQELTVLLLGLDAIAPRLDPKEAARLYAPARYAHLMTGSSQLIAGFSAAAVRMKNEDASDTLLQAMAKANHPSELHAFAEALSRVAARMEPKEAARTCSQAAAVLAAAMQKKDDFSSSLYTQGLLVEGISAVAPYLEDKEASHVFSQAIGSILQALAKTEDDHSYWGLEGLGAMASHMQGEEASLAAVLLNRALARFFELRIRRVSDSRLRGFSMNGLEALAKALSIVSGRLQPDEATRVCGQASEMLLLALAKSPDSRLAMVLSQVAARLEVKHGASACARAATLLMPVGQMYPFQASNLANALSALAARMDPNEAARVCSQAAAHYIRLMAMTKTEGVEVDLFANGLTAILVRLDPRPRVRRSFAVVTAIGLMARNSYPVAPAVVLRTAREPLPGRLSGQELVGLLKQPTCLGRARRIILDQLESCYKRPFTDHWAFVEYTQEQKLDMDLTTPPTYRLPSAGGETN